MKKILIGLLLATLLLGCIQLSAEQIAKQMEEKYEKMEDMKGKMVVTTEFEGEKQIMETKFWYKKPDMWRSEDENSTTASNGSMMWIYDKRKNEVAKIKLQKTEKPDFDYGKILEDMLEKYEVRLAGEEKIAGRDCYVIEAKPKEEKLIVKQKFWIDKEFWYPLRIETDYGEFNSTLEYKDVEFNTGIPDQEFEFIPPEGVKVVEKEFKLPEKLTMEEAQQRINFTIVKPEYTAGYEFSYAKVFKFGKERVMLYYKKDESVMTISESNIESRPMPNATRVKIDGIEGEIAEMFGNRMLKLHIDGVEVVIAGKLSEEELVRIAESMI